MPPADPRHGRVLIVEDDEAHATIVSAVVTNLGYEAVVTHTGLGVLNLIAKLRPVLVVLDLKLPGLGGAGVMQLLRSDPELKATRVIFHSAEDEATLMATTKRLQADGCFQKGQRPSALRAYLRRWIP
jgi:CheY-like chemotaxis protein